jgi:hypothetical protein
MKRNRKLAILAVFALLVISVPLAVQPAFGCYEGCTPGFWKNHLSVPPWPTEVCVDLSPEGGTWTAYKPTADCAAFGGAIFTLGDEPWNTPLATFFKLDCLAGVEPFAGATLLDALQFQGGPGVEGKAEILYRAAAASIINGAGLLHQPPGTTIVKTDNAVAKGCATGNWNTMIYWADFFDYQVNNNFCPY